MDRVGPQPAESRRWWLVLLATSIGAFIVAANLSTVNVANPTIRKHFDASLSSVSWVVTAYAIVFAALLVPAGRVADRYGRRMLYVSGLCVFAAGSLVSGIGPHLWIVVVGRAIQGIGAACITPSAIGLLLEITPAARRTRALAWTGGVSSMGVAMGPTLGALVVDHLGWRWSFLIAPPFALVSYAVGRNVMPRTRQADAEGRIDGLGIVLAIGAMALVTLAISEGRRWGWTNGKTIVAFAVGALCAALFVMQCRRHPAPVLPLRLFRARSFTVASIAGVVYGVASGSILLVNVFFLTQIWHYSPSKAGFSMIPGPVVASFVALFVGRVGSKYGERALAVTSRAPMRHRCPARSFSGSASSCRSSPCWHRRACAMSSPTRCRSRRRRYAARSSSAKRPVTRSSPRFWAQIPTPLTCFTVRGSSWSRAASVRPSCA